MIIFNFKFRDMKKQVLMMAALALALGGCSKTETTGSAQGGTIGFAGSGVNNITKAGDLVDNNFRKFYVYGSYQETGGTIVDRFTKQEVTKPENTWGYTPTQYWANGTWRFGAYYSDAAEGGVVPSWSYADGLKLVVNSDNSHQGDLVYAAPENDITVDDATTYNTEVSLTFKHLLSKIQFKFTMGESVAAYTVKLSNFKVANIITDGTWEKDRCTVGSTKAEAGYTDFATTETIAEGGLVAGPFYVIPQAVGTDANAFTITFNAEVTDGKTVYKNGTVTATVPVGSYPNWDAQNYYQYSAEINMTNIDDPNTPDEDLQPIVFAVEDLDGWDTITPEISTTLNDVEP